jgi:S-adenosylmethionine-diacylglycerol 3-amino-3-carboxypropyl transferase
MTSAPAFADKSALLSAAVHRNTAYSIDGMLERAFTSLFRNLVYAQIWEDPVVDLEALNLQPDSQVVTIASGGCNILTYLTANPARIYGVDLNEAHVALNRLKLIAVERLPDHRSFQQFFLGAADGDNTRLFDQYLASHVDAETQRHWQGRDRLGRRRITAFSRNFYRTGLLGRFIGVAHAVARAHGVDPRQMTSMTTREAQVKFFEAKLAPLFDRWIVRKALDSPMSLYGLGIPPAQFTELRADAQRMSDVVCERLRKLCCDFDMQDNYFAWQAFNRGYSARGPLPLYLQEQHFNTIRRRVARVRIQRISFTDYLSQQSSRSLDRYVLLDAQDWMNDDDLTQLWQEITRTARTDARVIFRTAGEKSILIDRLPHELLRQWNYQERHSQDLHRRDRSAIYGGFHLYTRAA